MLIYYCIDETYFLFLGMARVKSRLYYHKGTILQRSYMSFSYYSIIIPIITLLKFHGKKICDDNITALYPNPGYKKVCYKVTAL